MCIYLVPLCGSLKHLVIISGEAAQQECCLTYTAKSCVFQESKKDSGTTVIMEGRGLGTCGLMIEVFTDKAHKTRQEVHSILKKFGSVFQLRQTLFVDSLP